MFIEHGVNKENGRWIYMTADNENIARKVEDYFISLIGLDGCVGGGDSTAKIVYAYKKTKDTNP